MQIDKKWLIALVNEVKDEIDVESAIKDDEKEEKNENYKKNKKDKKDENKGVGTNQFRTLASLCLVAETYDEIKLLVQYKTAKAHKFESWRISKDGKKNFGNVIIDKMEKIKNKYKEDTVVLEAMRLFFGYLYQSARVWKYDIAVSVNNKNYNKNYR